MFFLFPQPFTGLSDNLTSDRWWGVRLKVFERRFEADDEIGLGSSREGGVRKDTSEMD